MENVHKNIITSVCVYAYDFFFFSMVTDGAKSPGSREHVEKKTLY